MSDWLYCITSQFICGRICHNIKAATAVLPISHRPILAERPAANHSYILHKVSQPDLRQEII